MSVPRRRAAVVAVAAVVFRTAVAVGAIRNCAAMQSAAAQLFPRHPLASPSSGIYFSTQPTANQRTVVAAFVKKAGLHVLQGADLTKISLPIEVFEPRTFLERLPLDLLHAPRLLNLAAAACSDLERFQYCIALMISGRNTTACSADKPLNPCLGETYQGVLDDGSRVFVEQVQQRAQSSRRAARHAPL